MKEFKANPLGKGNNKLFPPKIQIHDEGVKYIQQGAFRGKEFLVPYSEISEVNISTPLIGFASVQIRGGKFSYLDPISGFTNAEAREIKELIELGKKDPKELHSIISGDFVMGTLDDSVNNSSTVEERTNVATKSIAPPPPPIFSFYALIDNKQYGPYDKIQFKRLVDNDMVSKDTFVWKEGMEQWQAAKEVPEMEEFFPQKNPSTPPPPPPSPQGPPPPPIG